MDDATNPSLTQQKVAEPDWLGASFKGQIFRAIAQFPPTVNSIHQNHQTRPADASPISLESHGEWVNVPVEAICLEEGRHSFA